MSFAHLHPSRFSLGHTAPTIHANILQNLTILPLELFVHVLRYVKPLFCGHASRVCHLCRRNSSRTASVKEVKGGLHHLRTPVCLVFFTHNCRTGNKPKRSAPGSTNIQQPVVPHGDILEMQSSNTLQYDDDAQNKARQSRRKGRRESYTRFSSSEQQNLLDGVARYGAGNWKKILSAYSFHSKRTAVDLKDKYRNILRAQERARNANLKSASSHSPTSASRHDHSHPPVHMRGASSSSSKQTPDSPYAFRNMSDVPAPAEPPVSSSNYRPRPNLSSAAPHHRSSSSFPTASGSPTARNHVSRRGSAQASGSGSHKQRTSSMPVAALLTAPDVSY